MKRSHQTKSALKLAFSVTALLFSAFALSNPQQTTPTKVEAEPAAVKKTVPAHSHPRDAKGLTTGKKAEQKEEKASEEKPDAATVDTKKAAAAKATTPHNHMRDAKGIYVAPKPADKPADKPAAKPEEKPAVKPEGK
ncbi:MAG: hypothetical protein Q8Q55_01410 [Undibacterium sp.]|nr:hypothetical protein [Undibacterium sp.]